MEIEVNGVGCRYLDKGSGPAVILLHGFASQRSTWRETVSALSQRFRVLAVDLPGFGESEKPPDFDYDLPGYTKWIAAFMDAIRAPRAAVIGNSMGGGIAYTLATSCPERVSHLVLVDAVGYQPRPERFFIFRLMAMRGVGEILTAMMTRLSVRAILATFLYRDSRFVTGEVVDKYLAPFRTREGRAAALRTIRRVDFDSAPGPIACAAPTLIVWGARDRIVPASHGQRYAEDIPGARLHVFEDCGHFPQEERSEEFNRIVESFLEQQP